MHTRRVMYIFLCEMYLKLDAATLVQQYSTGSWGNSLTDAESQEVRDLSTASEVSHIQGDTHDLTCKSFSTGPPQAPHAKWVLEGPSQAFDSLGWRVSTIAPQACHLHPQEDKIK